MVVKVTIKYLHNSQHNFSTHHHPLFRMCICFYIQADGNKLCATACVDSFAQAAAMRPPVAASRGGASAGSLHGRSEEGTLGLAVRQICSFRIGEPSVRGPPKHKGTENAKKKSLQA